MSLSTMSCVRTDRPWNSDVPSQIPSTGVGSFAGTNVSRVKVSGMGVPWDQVPTRVVPPFSMFPFQVPLTVGTVKERALPSTARSEQGSPMAP